MKTIAFVNFKGGVAKTISSVNVAGALAADYHKRVLLVDADPQANATQSLVTPSEYNTMSALLDGSAQYYEDLIVPSRIRGLDVLPADDGLREFELALLKGERPNLTGLRDLRDAVIEDDAYDYIICDCPPSLSPSCAAAIVASTDVVIPVKIDAYSVKGMNSLMYQINLLRRLYPDVHVAGCLPTIWYRGESILQGEALLREKARVKVFDTHIRRSPKVDESTWTEPVIFWSPNSAAGQDYRAFVEEFLGEEAMGSGQEI